MINTEIRCIRWHLTPVLLPGKSHGWRSLVGGSPWGHEESDMTEWFHFHISLSCIGEGNGNPLQCSCLENPRDGGAWWAAVYGVAQSWTQLKQISSSRSSSVFFAAEDEETWYSQQKTRTEADCGSNHYCKIKFLFQLCIVKFRLKLKKVGKTTRSPGMP